MNELMPEVKKVFEISCSKSVSFIDAVKLVPTINRSTGTRLLYLDVDGTDKDIVFTLEKLDIAEEEWLDFINWSILNK